MAVCGKTGCHFLYLNINFVPPGSSLPALNRYAFRLSEVRSLRNDKDAKLVKLGNQPIVTAYGAKRLLR